MDRAIDPKWEDPLPGDFQQLREVIFSRWIEDVDDTVPNRMRIYEFITNALTAIDNHRTERIREMERSITGLLCTRTNILPIQL